jgi:hypothetical protein
MTSLEWNLPWLLPSVTIGGLLAPLLEFLLPRWLFEQILICSRLLYIGVLSLSFGQDRFELPYDFWVKRLRNKLDRLNNRLNCHPTFIKHKRLLSACRPSQFLSFKRRGNMPYLPPEVWEKILEFVIDVPFVFDTSCDAASFHHLVSSQSYFSISSYNLFKGRKNTLRLVCKMWKELVDRRSPYWIWGGEDIPWERIKMTRRIDILLTQLPVDSQSTEKIQYDVYPVLETPEVLNSLTNICMEDLSGNDGDENRTLTMHLFSRMSQLPNLRVLSYIHYYERVNFTFPELQTYFTSIRFLSIYSQEIHGSLHLANLEALYLNVKTYNVGGWWLPSLRYLAIGMYGRNTLSRNGANEVAPISSSSRHGLESLLLYDISTKLEIDEHFWATHPRLKCLGGCFPYMNIIGGPPPNHPLRQVVHTTPRTGGLELARSIASLPKSLDRIYMPFRRDHSFLETDTAWVNLVQEHRQKGTIWLDYNGMEIRYKRVLRKTQSTSLQVASWLYCYTYCSFDLIFCMSMWTMRAPFPFHESVVFRVILTHLAIRWLTDLVWTRFVSPQYRWVCDSQRIP